MTTMIDKIARALLASESDGGLAWEKLDLTTRGAFKRDARAALTAMLEPTEAMVEAGTMFDIDNGRGGFVNLRGDEVSQIHRELIQAALDEE